MAYQFPKTPALGTTWIPTYGQTFHNTQQQNTTTIPGVPQSPAQSAPQNAAAYKTFGHDANAQIRPPIPPFPFPHTFPEMFKQMSSSTFPPPPPTFPQIQANALFPPFSPLQPMAAQSVSGQNNARPEAQAGALPIQQSQAGGNASSGAPHMSIDTSHFSSPLWRNRQSDHSHQGQAIHPQSGIEDLVQHETFDDAAMDLQTSPFPDDGKSFSIFQDDVPDNEKNHEDDPDRESSYDPMRPFLTHTESIHRKASNTATIPVDGETKLNSDHRRKKLEELKTSAKGALEFLTLHNIKYHDLLLEGINRDVLTALYGELGIDVKTAPAAVHDDKAVNLSRSSPNTMLLDDKPLPSASSKNSVPMAIPVALIPATTANTNQPALTPVAPPVPSISPGMERKDRIAQLLAAKTGRSSSTHSTPEIPSPIPQGKPLDAARATEIVATTSALGLQHSNDTTSGISDPIPATEVETARNSNQQRDRTDHEEAIISALKGVQASTGTAITTLSDSTSPDQAIELTTPIREQLIQNGFGSLIPGLFMTLEEEPRGDLASGLFVSVNAESGMPHVPSTTLRKRAPDDSALVDAEPPAKRLSIGSGNAVDAVDAEMTYSPNEEASEGEIVETSGTNDSAGHGSMESTVPPQGEPGVMDIAVTKPQDSDDSPQKTHKQAYSQHTSPLPSKPPTPSATMPIMHPSAPTVEAKQADIDNASKPTAPVRAISKLTKEEFAERAAALKANVLRQRALRQKQLKEELPDLNAEVARTGQRLADVKEQLHQSQQKLGELREQLSKQTRKESELIQEIAALEQQMQAGVAGQKKFTDELDNLDARQKQESSRPESSSHTPIEGLDTEAQVSQSGPVDTIAASQDSDHVPTAKVDSTDDIMAAAQPVTEAHDQHVQSNLSTVMASDDPPSQHEDDPRAIVATDEVSEEVITMDESAKALADNSSMDLDEDTEDSASMSSSSTEDYEPAEPEPKDVAQGTPPDRIEVDEYDPQIPIEQFHDENVHDLQIEDNEDYEPTDEVPGTSVMPSQAATPSQPSPQTASSNGIPDSTALVSAQDSITITDDIEKPYQLTESDQTVSENVHAATERNISLPTTGVPATTRSPRFTPYSSPLSSFKTFRFHPDFHELVRNGYRSLTYSYNIDPSRPICPTELAGETCTDPNCEEQHFRTMSLTDDKILIQLSSASDLKDKTQRDQYLLGLKQVIADLRSRGVKEFDSVAEALSQYRRRFWKKLEGGEEVEERSIQANGQRDVPEQSHTAKFAPALVQLVAEDQDTQAGEIQESTFPASQVPAAPQEGVQQMQEDPTPAIVPIDGST